jgi:hypothetical protein
VKTGAHRVAVASVAINNSTLSDCDAGAPALWNALGRAIGLATI